MMRCLNYGFLQMADYIEAVFDQDKSKLDEALHSGREYTIQSMVTISQYIKYLSETISETLERQEKSVDQLKGGIALLELKSRLDRRTTVFGLSSPSQLKNELSTSLPTETSCQIQNAGPSHQRTRPVLDISAYDSVGTSLATDEERQLDAQYRRERRRPSVRRGADNALRLSNDGRPEPSPRHPASAVPAPGRAPSSAAAAAAPPAAFAERAPSSGSAPFVKSHSNNQIVSKPSPPSAPPPSAIPQSPLHRCIIYNTY